MCSYSSAWQHGSIQLHGVYMLICNQLIPNQVPSTGVAQRLRSRSHLGPGGSSSESEWESDRFWFAKLRGGSNARDGPAKSAFYVADLYRCLETSEGIEVIREQKRDRKLKRVHIETLSVNSLGNSAEV